MIVDYAIYERGRRRPETPALDELYDQSRAPEAFAWIGLAEPSAEEFESVRREFNLHELAVEDAIKAHQRPKAERYGDSFFLVLKTARFAERETLELGEILLFVGDEFVVSVRHGEFPLHEVRLRLESRPDLLRCGPSAVVHAIVDSVVDTYEPLAEALDVSVGEVERGVFSGARANPAARIFQLKRDVLELHAAVHPLLEPLELLARGGFAVHDEIRPYFRDVHDHLLRVNARVQYLRELLTSILTANLTQTTIRQNEDVRKISAWAAIIAVPTMVAGIYGMNFEHMPELGWTFGYPLVLAVIAGACLTLYWRFRRSGWL